MSVLSKPYFHDEEAAFRYLESIVWAGGKSCPHCGAVDRLTAVKANPEKRIRVGLHRCGHCKGQFTVKVGTVFEHMRLPLHKALQAVYLMTSSKKGISSHQLHRVLEITYKSAWFLSHRIREAMRDGDLAPFGVGGGIVEIDETFIGHDKTIKAAGDYARETQPIRIRNLSSTGLMADSQVAYDEGAFVEVDLRATEIISEEVPEGIVLVSESGIKTQADTRRVFAAGVNAVLVGESLMRSGDVPGQVAALLDVL